MTIRESVTAWPLYWPPGKSRTFDPSRHHGFRTNSVNFQSQFADDVESGEKLHTMRADRKIPFKVGDRLYLYTGMRTKACRKLGEAICTGVSPVWLYSNKRGECRVALDGVAIPVPKIDELAVADGFGSSDAMLDWFRKTHGIPFSGQLVRWEEIER